MFAVINQSFGSLYIECSRMVSTIRFKPWSWIASSINLDIQSLRGTCFSIKVYLLQSITIQWVLLDRWNSTFDLLAWTWRRKKLLTQDGAKREHLRRDLNSTITSTQGKQIWDSKVIEFIVLEQTTYSCYCLQMRCFVQEAGDADKGRNVTEQEDITKQCTMNSNLTVLVISTWIMVHLSHYEIKYPQAVHYEIHHLPLTIWYARAQREEGDAAASFQSYW